MSRVFFYLFCYEFYYPSFLYFGVPNNQFYCIKNNTIKTHISIIYFNTTPPPSWMRACRDWLNLKDTIFTSINHFANIWFNLLTITGTLDVQSFILKLCFHIYIDTIKIYSTFAHKIIYSIKPWKSHKKTVTNARI